MKKCIVSAAAVTAMSAFAVAGGDIAPVSMEPVVPAVENDNGFYLGLAYGAGRAKEDVSGDLDGGYVVFGGTEEIDYDTIMLQAGYKFNDYLALEGRYWRSFGDNGWSYSESGYEASVPYTFSETGKNGDNLKAYGIYLKPMYPLTEELDIYALLGYGNVTLNDDEHGDWADENGFQYGVGVSYALTNNLSIFVDYMRLLDDDSSVHTGAQIGGSNIYFDHRLYIVNAGLSYRF
ncbi:MAG: porin family protein [Sulfurovum sp.]|nr:porin family protein [Sulfurovum sp.]